MRADRLLSIMMILQVRGRVTARELARRLEVSERTIHRDMEALSVAGIPVFAERGSRGGWAMLEEYRTNLTGLSRSEIEALFLTNPSRLLADLGLDKASDGAFLKLLASLSSVRRADAERVRQRIYIDPTGWNRSGESTPLISAIQEAVWRERKLRMAYMRGSSESVERLVDPMGLVAKGGVWYLVAIAEGEARSYRVSRVLRAEVLDEPSARPEGFDLEAYWEQSTVRFRESLPRYVVRFRVSPDALPRLPYAGRFAKIESVGQRDEEGWTEAVVRFDVEEVACEYALSFGPHVEVLEPREMRDKVIEMAKSVVEFYSRKC